MAEEKEEKQVPVAVETIPMGKGQTILAIGRRKTAVARVRLLSQGKGVIMVNGKPMNAYFTTFEQRAAVINPLKNVTVDQTVDVQVRVQGGGIHSQAEAVRLGISRALVEWNAGYRKVLKKLGYMTRDPREKERKKPGLKRARRAPQWSKR